MAAATVDVSASTLALCNFALISGKASAMFPQDYTIGEFMADAIHERACMLTIHRFLRNLD